MLISSISPESRARPFLLTNDSQIPEKSHSLRYFGESHRVSYLTLHQFCLPWSAPGQKPTLGYLEVASRPLPACGTDLTTFIFLPKAVSPNNLKAANTILQSVAVSSRFLYIGWNSPKSSASSQSLWHDSISECQKIPISSIIRKETFDEMTVNFMNCR